MTAQFRQIIVHAGLHKTGTTSVQRSARKYRELLAEHSIVYPLFDCGEQTLDNHSDPITAVLFDESNKYGWAWRRKVLDREEEVRGSIREQMSHVLASGDEDSSLFLSGENLSRYSIDEIRLLRDYLEPHAQSVRFLVCVRDPLEAAQSLLQQRMYGGREATLAEVAGVFETRLGQMREGLGDQLEIVLYHDAMADRGGLVGHFLGKLGLAANVIDGLYFEHSNRRMSMEAFQIMSAINTRFPLDGAETTKSIRSHHDLQALHHLPGQPFSIECFDGDESYAAILRERERLESSLSCEFPRPLVFDAALWQSDTLLQLKSTIAQIARPELREEAAYCLQSEAAELALDRPDTAGVLAFIAMQILTPDSAGMETMVSAVGADFFRDEALRREEGNLERAIELMRIAHRLRPSGQLINDKLKEWETMLANRTTIELNRVADDE